MTPEDLTELVELTKQSVDSLTSRELGLLESAADYCLLKVASEIAKEREACAKLAEEEFSVTASRIASAIRSRGEKR